MIRLPIDELLPEISQKLKEHQNLLLLSSPGSGKTTRVPWFLSQRSSGKIYVLEPRRLAARLSATRVAQENGVQLGDREVGYQFRLDKKRTDQTKLVFLTEGMLLREALTNRTLKGVSMVVLDEFHERHLQTDLALGFLKRLQATERPDLKIVLMSATVEPSPIQKYFSGVIEVVTQQSAVHPVEIENREPSRALSVEVARAVRDLCAKPDSQKYGDILVFLPGMREILEAQKELSEGAHQVLILHGDLSAQEQAQAFEKSSKRKVILSTNIAESALTIEGVNMVIDSGLSRVADYSPTTGVTRLRTKNISRASAIQRAGRAGRTGPGRVVRLYSRGDFEARAFADLAEIHRSDITHAILELSELGIADVREFAWFEKPANDRLDSFLEILKWLGAITPENQLTEMGKKMAHAPTSPRAAKALFTAQKLGAFDETLNAVLAIEEDLDVGFDFIEGLRRLRLSHHQQALKDRLVRFFDSPKKSSGSLEAMIQSLLSGWPDRVLKKRGAELVRASGDSLKAPIDPLLQTSEYFLATQLRETQKLDQYKSNAILQSAIAIDDSQLLDLEPALVEEKSDLVWDQNRKRWMNQSQMTFLSLTLSESQKPAEASDALRDKLIDLWIKEHKVEMQPWQIRFELLKQFTPSFTPENTFADLCARVIREIYMGQTALSDLPTLEDLTSQYFPRNLAQTFEEQTPLFLSLPGRKRVPVQYPGTQPPFIESRIQDYFGLMDGPKICGGKLALVLHLNAPSGRAVQVTQDLKGFWVNHYPSIRKELMRQYPRHKWPEDPKRVLEPSSK